MEGLLLKLFVKEFWTFGASVSAHFFIYAAILTLLIQIGWVAYRYVTDAAREYDRIGYSRRDRDRKIFCGEFLSKHIPKSLPGSETHADEPWNFVAVILLYLACGLAASLAWPLILVYLFVHGLLFGLRCAVRFKRKVNEALAKKAEKDHNHDDLYVRK